MTVKMVVPTPGSLLVNGETVGRAVMGVLKIQGLGGWHCVPTHMMQAFAVLHPWILPHAYPDFARQDA
jgi:hypothetical protein